MILLNLYKIYMKMLVVLQKINQYLMDKGIKFIIV